MILVLGCFVAATLRVIGVILVTNIALVGFAPHGLAVVPWHRINGIGVNHRPTPLLSARAAALRSPL